jgi:hypothetical protein
MEQNLIGYLLDALDPATQREVEAYLRDRPEARKELEVLRQALQPLDADRDTIEPPLQLAERTLARIETERDKIPGPVAPPVPRASIPISSWWRRPDVLVAAALLIVALGIASPGLFRLRSVYYARTQCADNMRELHQSLVGYGDHNGGFFPAAEERPRRNVAGIYMPVLKDSGMLSRNFVCPSNGDQGVPPWTMRELDQMSQEEFERNAPRLSAGYAYTLGYRDAHGDLHGMRNDDGDDLPLVADRPVTIDEDTSCPGERGSSPNHSGQNVLYIGGQVKFHKLPTAGRAGDNIFLNRLGKVKAGVDKDDTVLGMSADRP